MASLCPRSLEQHGQQLRHENARPRPSNSRGSLYPSDRRAGLCWHRTRAVSRCLRGNHTRIRRHDVCEQLRGRRTALLVLGDDCVDGVVGAQKPNKVLSPFASCMSHTYPREPLGTNTRLKQPAVRSLLLAHPCSRLNPDHQRLEPDRPEVRRGTRHREDVHRPEAEVPLVPNRGHLRLAPTTTHEALRAEPALDLGFAGGGTRVCSVHLQARFYERGLPRAGGGASVQPPRCYSQFLPRNSRANGLRWRPRDGRVCGFP